MSGKSTQPSKKCNLAAGLDETEENMVLGIILVWSDASRYDRDRRSFFVRCYDKGWCVLSSMIK